MTNEDFELYLRGEVQRLVRDLANVPVNITLTVEFDYKNSTIKRGVWTVYDGYQKPTTSGEILADVINEHNRRLGFDKSCTLRLIEHTAEEN